MPEYFLNAVAAIASCISAAGVFFLWKQIRADHERARREKAIELMQFYVTSTASYDGVGGGLLRKFARELDKQQCELLVNCQPMRIDGKYSELLRPIFNSLTGDSALQEHGSELVLTVTQVTILKQQIYLYLNVVETVSAAWRYNIADRDIIEDEFLDVVLERRGIFDYRDLRYLSGAFPSITALSRALERRRGNLQGKAPIA